MPKVWLRPTAALVTLAAALAARAQQQPAAPEPAQQNPGGYTTETLKVKTQLVVLDVVVTDKKGKLVNRTFTADDFQVYDNGALQHIRHFETPEEHQMPDPGKDIVHSAADLKKIGDAPVTLLVIDELDGRFEDMAYSRQMLVKYLQSQPAILPNPAVLMVATNTTFQQIHDYTQNRDELIQTVKKHMPENPYKAEARSGAQAVERLAQVLNALQEISESTSGTPGRKNLVWVGNGFPSANLVGLDDLTIQRLEDAIRRMTSRLLAARITVYTINPTAATSATVDIESVDDLTLASDANGGDPFGGGDISFSNVGPSTGGYAFTGRNDIENLIGESIDKGRDYYTLSYSPTYPTPPTNPTQYRNVRIVMKDPNLVATTREGYYPDAEADLNPVIDKTMDPRQVRANLQLDLSNALTTTISYNGLDITPTKVKGGDWNIQVAEKGIGWSDPDDKGDSHAEATVAAGWYDAKGKLLGHAAHEEVSQRGNGGAGFTISLTLPANTARVRFVVRDARNGHMGTADVTKF